jgi:hypothetical protein
MMRDCGGVSFARGAAPPQATANAANIATAATTEQLLLNDTRFGLRAGEPDSTTRFQSRPGRVASVARRARKKRLP